MRYVVVGAGAAGISAARTLRQLDREGDIVLVSKDDKVHSRCMLHKYLGGQRTAGEIDFTPPDFFESLGIDWIAGKATTRLHCEEERIELDDGH